MMWLLFGGRKMCTWHQQWSWAPVSRSHYAADFQGIISLLSLMRQLGWSPGTLKPFSNSGLSPWPAVRAGATWNERLVSGSQSKVGVRVLLWLEEGWLWLNVLQKLELCLGLLEIWNNMSILMMPRRDKQLVPGLSKVTAEGWRKRSWLCSDMRSTGQSMMLRSQVWSLYGPLTQA